IEKGEQEVADLGGSPSEVPGPYLTLMAGEWDDPPAPGDADRWLALLMPDPRDSPPARRTSSES
ncbi:MAG: hypothetical protein K8U57_19655, partial [Planctomycetes bacterium]|nr:hypothetical protein [Planctomycetota bacterium]